MESLNNLNEFQVIIRKLAEISRKFRLSFCNCEDSWRNFEDSLRISCNLDGISRISFGNSFLSSTNPRKLNSNPSTSLYNNVHVFNIFSKSSRLTSLYMQLELQIAGQQKKERSNPRAR